MARPLKFDKEAALQDAMNVFWTKGYAAASTDELLESMGIGRQSLYNAFGDKHSLYLEALKTYLRDTAAGHLKRLNTATSPLEGIRDLLLGLNQGVDRSLGCMGVCSVGEFGKEDKEISDIRKKAAQLVSIQLIKRIREGQAKGEIISTIDPEEAANFVQMNMNGLQVAARAGAKTSELSGLANFTIDRLRKV